MARTIVDLSVVLEDEPSDPPFHRPSIDYMLHDSNPAQVEKVSGLPIDAFFDRKAWASERVTLSTHSGTHMDAPWHYHPTMNHALKAGGERASSIEEVPLDWCFQPGVKLDFRRFPAGYVVKAQDVRDELQRIGHDLRPLDIVLVNTRAGALYGQVDYWKSNCGMGREATLYLLERGVRVVGIDAWGWDVHFSFSREIYEKTGDKTVIWEGHKAGVELGYYQMEKMTNLERLPSTGFTVICFPMKIKSASAGWTRAVAIIDEPNSPPAEKD